METTVPGTPEPWGRRTPRGIAWRIFWTAWIVFSLHFATDIVREHYPAVALGDDFTFRLDQYGGLHPDLFETPGRGWHIGNNPGISMFAAIPYLLARPVIDPIVERVQENRRAAGLTEPPAYDTEWPNQRVFFAEAWRRGLDIKLGLAALVMQVLFMAPVCAAAVALMFRTLRQVLGSDRSAGWLSLLFAFGTPLFYRAAFLNHNMVLGLIAFWAFVAIWDPGGARPLTVRSQMAVAGLAAGLTLLFDYSGVVFVALLFGYALVRNRETLTGATLFDRGLWFGIGGVLPVALLWFYQWRAFGNPFLPGQHWMPPVEWIELGYQGYGPPQLELLRMLLFDHRFGLFVFSPMLLLAFAALHPRVRARANLPSLETWMCIGVFVASWIFFAGSNYTRLQFNTGLRYLPPVIPVLFLASAVTMDRLPRVAAWLVGVVSVCFTWALSMYREVERPLGVLDPVVRLFTEGLQLPAQASLERMGGAYGGIPSLLLSPLVPLLVTAALIFVVWWVPDRSSDLRTR